MKDSTVRKLGSGKDAIPASVERENVSAFVREGDSALSDAEVMAVSYALRSRPRQPGLRSDLPRTMPCLTATSGLPATPCSCSLH